MSLGDRGGLAGVHKRAEEILSQRQSFGLRRNTPEFRWDGNKPPAENALNLRLLGDDIIVPTKQHRGVPLPENKFFFGICRHAFPVEAKFCYVCDVMGQEFDGDAKQKKRNGLVPVDIAVGLAVEMEPVTTRSTVEWKPKLVEFEIPAIKDAEKSDDATSEDKQYRRLLNGLGVPGAKVLIPNIGMVVGTISGQQALWDYATRRKSVSDRVFEISRYGKALDTKWVWDHDGADKEMPDPTPLLEEFQGKYPFETPEEWVLRNASEERYNYFFKLTDEGSATATPATVEDDDVAPVSNSRSQLMERLRGRGVE